MTGRRWIMVVLAIVVVMAAFVAILYKVAPHLVARRDLAKLRDAVGNSRELVIKKFEVDEGPPGWTDAETISDQGRIQEILDHLDIVPNKLFESRHCACSGQYRLEFQTEDGPVVVRIHHMESFAYSQWDTQYWMTDASIAYFEKLLSP